MADDCTKLDKGDIRFYDNYVPTLEVGDYLINLTQRINPAGTQIDESYAASQAFSVQGPRYALPPEDIFSVFPPNNSMGIFDQFLPHVVLTKQDLPWERDIFEDQRSQRAQTPWMALLLFSEDEAEKEAGAAGKFLFAPKLSDWTRNQVMSAVIPAASFYENSRSRTQPDREGILWPELEVEWYETEDFLKSTSSSIIDISPEAFATLVPRPADLQYLAHVRQVDPSGKDAEVLKISGTGWYSTIVVNRLPAAPPAGSDAPPKRNIAHLVSLEGFQEYLTGDSLPPTANRVRMISLKGWSFTCHPELNESFARLMEGLLYDRPNVREGKKSTTFVLPVKTPSEPDDEAQYSYQSIQQGYVPLRYQTRLGEQTFAWYRGPFSPVPVKNFISKDPVNWKPFDTASSALIYDKNRGIFDVSYAVAWETGRLLALSNGHLSQEMLDWQRKGHHLVDLIMERKSQVDVLKNFDRNNPDPVTEKNLLDLIKSYAVTDDFMTYLITQFSGRMVPKPSDQTTEVPATQPAKPFPAYADKPASSINPQSVESLLATDEVKAAIRDVGGPELDDIADWLAQLYVLIGVPFENLVPNATLLPTESVRFFYLDSNWLEALVEGALSIGVESSRDRVYQDLMKDLIWDTTFAALQKTREKLLGDLATQKPAGSNVAFNQESLTGMLLRSSVVSGWPGLEVNGYGKYTLDAGNVKVDVNSQINLLRMERLSSDVLLCLWPSVPAVIAIDEPHEGVAFGFEDPPEGEGKHLYLRSVGSTDYGKLLSGNPGIDAGPVIDSKGIVKIGGDDGLLKKIQNSLPNSPQLRVRDFAVQMIKVPEQAVFAYKPSAKGGGDNG